MTKCRVGWMSLISGGDVADVVTELSPATKERSLLLTSKLFDDTLTNSFFPK